MKLNPAELLIDDSGKLSMSRTMIIVVVCAYLALAGYLSIKTDKLVDIPVGAVGLVGVLYAANKFSPTYPYEPNKIPDGGQRAE